MLEVDDESRLGRELIAGGARYHAHFVPDDDAMADYYDQACETLASNSIEQYEISNFARHITPLQNYESRHNLKYWTRQPYLGFGVDAHSMLSKIQSGSAQGACSVASRSHLESQSMRFAAPDSLDAYMNHAPYTLSPVSPGAAIEEEFFLGLRLNRGIDLEKMNIVAGHGSSRTTNVNGQGVSAAEMERFEFAIDDCLQDGLLERQGSILRLTARGRLLSNEVFARFLQGSAAKTKVGTGHVNPR